MYEVVIKTSAQKELNRLPREAQARILATLDGLAKSPFQGKELRGDLKGLRAIRVWPYRIMYEIRKHELIVLVLEISHRKDSYR